MGRLQGRVLVDEVGRNSYYKKVALISYNTHIFNNSIRDNFILSNKNVTDEEIFKALKDVNLFDFVVEIGGLDYVIMEGSENISGGQRQRLAIAINLVTDKSLYIFDEATSNIDVESEEIIMNNILRLSETKIIILISHRLHNVINSNQILLLENGVVSETGIHDNLLKGNGGYARLFNEQFKLENGYKEVRNA